MFSNVVQWFLEMADIWSFSVSDLASWACGGVGLVWVDEDIGVGTVDVEVFEAEIKNEILVRRGQSHIVTEGYFS